MQITKDECTSLCTLNPQTYIYLESVSPEERLSTYTLHFQYNLLCSCQAKNAIKSYFGQCVIGTIRRFLATSVGRKDVALNISGMNTFSHSRSAHIYIKLNGIAI